MEPQHLVKMANNIGAFFNAEPNRSLVVAGIEQHLRKFWDPRMRREIVEYVRQGGSELLEVVAEAVGNLSIRD